MTADTPTRSRLIIAVSGVAIVLALVSMARRGSDRAELGQTQTYLSELGAFFAEETAAFLGPGENVVLLVPALPRRVTTRHVFEGFRRALEGEGIEVVDEIAIEMNGTLSDYAWSGHSRIPSGAFVDAMTKHDDAAIVVSLLGAPEFTEEMRKRLPALAPALVVAYDITNSPMHLSRLVRSGDVAMAILPRRMGGGPREEDETTETWARRMFEVVRSTAGGKAARGEGPPPTPWPASRRCEAGYISRDPLKTPPGLKITRVAVDAYRAKKVST